MPDVGVTWSHGCVGVAVQVTVPLPLRVRRTDWVEVFDTSVEPEITAPN